AAVVGGDEATVRLVNLVGVLRIDDEVGGVEGAPEHVLAAVARLPGLAAIVGAIEPVFRRLGFDEGVDDVRIRRGDGDGDAAPRLGGEAGGRRDLAPVRAAVGRLPEAAAARRIGAGAAGAEGPAFAAGVPHGRRSRPSGW